MCKKNTRAEHWGTNPILAPFQKIDPPVSSWKIATFHMQLFWIKIFHSMATCITLIQERFLKNHHPYIFLRTHVQSIKQPTRFRAIFQHRSILLRLRSAHVITFFPIFHPKNMNFSLLFCVAAPKLQQFTASRAPPSRAFCRKFSGFWDKKIEIFRL